MPVQNYEQLNVNTDVTTTRTVLHEAIPITGSIISGTYGNWPNEGNIKNYSAGMFQSVYDYPYLSSSANHIFDITFAYASTSGMSGSSGGTTQNAKKINMYNQFAQVLLGYSGSTNTIETFESDLNYGDDNRQMKEVFVINFSRLLTKDQMKKGSFSLVVGTGSWNNPFEAANAAGASSITTITITDASASSANDQGTKNTIGGDYGVLFMSQSGEAGGTSHYRSSDAVGVLFYQSGIAMVTASVFNSASDFYTGSGGSVYYNITQSLSGANITGSCDALRHRVQSLSFNNTTEINSQIYFCRVPHNKFNYSSNPTYLTGSKIRVKNVASDNPVTYITTIGLYAPDNELLAVAKLSEPLKKDPTNEMTLRVRLDY
jgi:hypothetical protein